MESDSKGGFVRNAVGLPAWLVSGWRSMGWEGAALQNVEYISTVFRVESFI
ncbi:hypothetical protein [Janthinobacterium sp. PC23-8]|uniref:hypothetical protein n=1 Tax=Janthinobacterium sp. PC23-8 TaxID=2012679 RepID=UPI0015957D16|nr:hypothetical protein [Janthinobacterium sp. PC23-8]